MNEKLKALIEAAQGGNETEDIWLSELQRIAGPDAELNAEAQGRLHTLRQQRHAALAALELPNDA
jgi:hypothetical protein